MTLTDAIAAAHTTGYEYIETAGGRFSLDIWPGGRHHDEYRATVGWKFDGRRLIHDGEPPFLTSVFPLARYVAPYVYV